MTNPTPAPSAPSVAVSFPEWVLFGSCVVVRLAEDRFAWLSPVGESFVVQLVAGEFIDLFGRVVAVDDGFLGLWDVPHILGPEFGASYTYSADDE